MPCLVRSTSARYGIRHGIRHTAVGAGCGRLRRSAGRSPRDRVAEHFSNLPVRFSPAIRPQNSKGGAAVFTLSGPDVSGEGTTCNRQCTEERNGLHPILTVDHPAMHNLLSDPLIRVRLVDGTSTMMSLPEVYEALAADGGGVGRVASRPDAGVQRRRTVAVDRGRSDAACLHAVSRRRTRWDSIAAG